MSKKIYFLTAVLAVSVSGFLLGNCVLAQSVGIKISPVRIEEIVEPGQTLLQQLKVTNESNIPKTLYVYLRDFKAEGESGKPKLIVPGSEEGYFLASWVDITTEGMEFGPREQKVIPFKINVPADAGPGGHYGAILFGTKPPKLQLDSEEKGAGMSIAQQTGGLVLLQVKGDVIEEARIREFATDKDFYSTPFNVNFLIRIENLGNVHIKPHGAIKVKNMFGREVTIIRVNDKGANVLPNSIRRFVTSWEASNGFGRYTASLGLTYGTPADVGGQGKQTLYTEKYFWIIPWRIIIPTLLGLIFVSALFILLLRLYKNKAVRRAMEQAGLGHVRYVKKYQGPSPAWHFSLILLIVFIVLFLIVAAAFFIFFA